MSNKAFEKCKKEIIETINSTKEFDIDDVLELVDNFDLSTEELDAIFDIIRNPDSDLESVAPEKSELQQLYEKYNVTLHRKKRIYKVNLDTRDFALFNSTPYLLTYNDFASQHHSWGNLLLDFVNYLEYNDPKKAEYLLGFNTDWSKQDIFSDRKKTNYKKLLNGLYLNCNHTALHSCWLLQDIIGLYDIDTNDVNLYIHRGNDCEPKELIEKIQNEVKLDFKKFLIDKHNKSEINAQKIISNIDIAMNPKLKELSSTYTNFFMFDDYVMLYNYSIKFESKIDENLRIPQKNKMIFKRYLSYLKEYYKLNGY